MKMKKFVSAFLVSAVAMSLFAGCGGDKKAADGKKAEGGNVVKVGVFLPLTGDNACRRRTGIARYQISEQITS